MLAALPIRLPSRKFVALVLGVFLLQLVFIFSLSDRRAPKAARHRPEARIVLLSDDVLTGASRELLRLRDPSLFALPHAESFSGVAWLSNAPLAYRAFDWTEPARWLPIHFPPVQAALLPLAGPVPAGWTSVAQRRPEPDLAVPGMLNTELLRPKSEVRIIMGPEVMNTMAFEGLPSWQHTDLVSNSVVKVAFTADGKMLSAALLAGSGFQPADDFALNYVRSLELAPLAEAQPKSPAGALRWAILRFEWHTGAQQQAP